ncbi:MAG: hypothetical protein ABL864_05280 [Terricaulis sp.]
MEPPFVSMGYYLRGGSVERALGALQIASPKALSSDSDEWQHFTTTGPLFDQGFELCGIGRHMLSLECSGELYADDPSDLEEPELSRYYSDAKSIADTFSRVAIAIGGTFGTLGVETKIRRPDDPAFASDVAQFETLYLSKTSYDASTIDEMERVFAGCTVRDLGAGKFFSASSIFGDGSLAVGAEQKWAIRRDAMLLLRAAG